MMTMTRIQTLIDAYGADPVRWPADERMAAQTFIASSPEARALLREAQDFDILLNQAPLSAPADINASALASRILASAPRSSERAVWQWSFGWPNFAALAAAAIAGFVVGTTDLSLSSTSYAGEMDLLEIMTTTPTADLEDI